MSRFASPHRQRYEPKPRQPRKKPEYDWPSDQSQRSASSDLPLPPPPPPETYSDSQSSISSSTLGTRRAKSPAWFDNRDPKPLLRGRSVLLANQLISTLNTDRGGPSSPTSVMFPSRHIGSSNVVRSAREDIASMKSEWSEQAAATIKHVQNLTAMTAHCRHQREMLNQQLVEKEFLAMTKTEELEDLYLHLEALEKIAEERHVKWVRPPLIRSNVRTISPRSTALSVASVGTSVGSKDSNWRNALRQLISPAKQPVTLPDGNADSAVPSTNTILETRGSAIALRDRLTALLDPEVPHNDDNGGDGRSLPPGHREAPRAPLGRPGGLVDREIRRVSPSRQPTPVGGGVPRGQLDAGRAVGEDEVVSESFKSGRVVGNTLQGKWSPCDQATGSPADRRPLYGGVDGSDGRAAGSGDEEEEEEIDFKRVNRKDIPMNRWVPAVSPNSPHPPRSPQGDVSISPDERVLSSSRSHVTWKAEKVSLTSAYVPPPPPVPPTPLTYVSTTAGVSQSSFPVSSDDTPWSKSSLKTAPAAAPVPSHLSPRTQTHGGGQLNDLSTDTYHTAPVHTSPQMKVQRSLFSAAVTPPPPPAAPPASLAARAQQAGPSTNASSTDTTAVVHVTAPEREPLKMSTGRAATPRRSAPRPPPPSQQRSGQNSRGGGGDSITSDALDSIVTSLSPAVEMTIPLQTEGREEQKQFDSIQEDCVASAEGRWSGDENGGTERASGSTGEDHTSRHVTLEDIASTNDFLRGEENCEDAYVDAPSVGSNRQDETHDSGGEDGYDDANRFRYIASCQGREKGKGEDGAAQVPIGNMRRQHDSDYREEYHDDGRPWDPVYDDDGEYRDGGHDGSSGDYRYVSSEEPHYDNGGLGGYGNRRSDFENEPGSSEEKKWRVDRDDDAEDDDNNYDEYYDDDIDEEGDHHREYSPQNSHPRRQMEGHKQPSYDAAAALGPVKVNADTRRPFQNSAAKLFDSAVDDDVEDKVVYTFFTCRPLQLMWS